MDEVLRRQKKFKVENVVSAKPPTPVQNEGKKQLKGQRLVNTLWYINFDKNQKATIYCPNGSTFIIKAGSKIKTKCHKSYSKLEKNRQKRSQILINNSYDNGDGSQTLLNDLDFKTANRATSFVLGRSTNAWKTLTNNTGQTASQVLR